MNELTRNGDKRMTTKEVAESLGVSEQAIRKHALEMGLTKNGVQTWLDEKAVTEIKLKIEYGGQIDLQARLQLPKTLLEKQLIIRQAAQLQDEIIADLQAQVSEMKPKAEFFDQVTDSKDAIEMSDAAKVLNMGIGRNTLFEILRDEGVLQKNNIPYQKYIDQGYFRVIEQSYQKPTGETCINLKTIVYQRGLDYIRRVVRKEI